MNSSKQYAYEIKLIIKNLNKISGLPECDPYKEELNRKCQCEGPGVGLSIQRLQWSCGKYVQITKGLHA